MARSRNSFSRRLFFVAFVCTAPLIPIFWRMYTLSVLDGSKFVDQVRDITCGQSVKMAYRGPILDRNGAALATSVQANRVSKSGRDYQYDPADAEGLAPYLLIPVDALDARLKEGKGRFGWLAKDISVDAARAIERARIRGIDVHQDQMRSYPHGSLAAHVVGFSGADAQGLEGVELALDDKIRGEAVSVEVCTDAHGRARLDAGDMAGVNQGATVTLTLDATLQSIAERELTARISEVDAHGGTVVILDPRSGELLAMVSRPVFDPNRYNSFVVGDRRNRAITDLFDPGSTTKPLLVAAAMQVGTITPESRYDCEHGAMRIGRRTIHDHKPHDVLDIADILRVSSNICAAKIGIEMGAEKLHAYLGKFGFGRRTAIELPGELPGLLRPHAQWRPIELANISFGQGVSVTALQMASAFSVLANGGVRMEPYVVSEVTGTNGDVIVDRAPRVEQRVVSEEIAATVTEMLEAVVSPRGTAPQAMIEGIRIAGKTGTAQKVVDGTYSKDHWVASFVGYLPADDPQLVIAVAIDEPQTHHYGGVVAAPVFKRIAEASLDYLHIHRTPTEHESPGRQGEPRQQFELETIPLLEASAVPHWERPPMPSPVRPGAALPDLAGLSLRGAMRVLQECECDIRVQGSGYVVSQQPPPGKPLLDAARVTLILAHDGVVQAVVAR